MQLIRHTPIIIFLFASIMAGRHDFSATNKFGGIRKMEGTKTSTSTERSVSQKGDCVTVTTKKTITTTKPGKDPEVKVETNVEKYEGKDGFDRLPAELRELLEESSKKKIDPKDIDFKAASSKFEEELLENLNKQRKTHHVEPLKLDDKVSKYAKARAKEMAEKDNTTPRTDLNYGESVSIFSSTDPKHRVDADDIIKQWCEAQKDYDYTKEPTKVPGSFTQMLWKSSKYFGAAAAKSNTNKIYIVAAFNPPGNYIGEFVENVLAPKKTVAAFLKNLVSKKDSSGSESSSDDDSDDENLDKFNEKGVRCHNKYRKKHGVQSVRYNKDIAKYAQEWANKLAASGKFEHRPRGEKKYGENIYQCQGMKKAPSASTACGAWYAEIKDYTFGMEPRSLKTGHFTQVVWKNSTEIGMGRARSANGSWIIVANYNPPGNFVGAYVQNVPKPN